jgi:hypothetical protein
MYVKTYGFVFRSSVSYTEVSTCGEWEYLNGVHVRCVPYRITLYDHIDEPLQVVTVHLSARELLNLISLAARGLFCRYIFFWR